MKNIFVNKNTSDESGFTLAELLIVVAIIGILVSISIPIFSGQLEHSKEAVDLANMRNAYALISVDAIMGDAVTNKHLYYDLSGNLVEEKPVAYGKGTSRNGNTSWGGCSDYTYNPEADYTGSVIDVWYDGRVVHVHWDNAASGSTDSSGGSQPEAGSGSGTSSGTSGGQGTNTGDGSGSSSQPSGGTGTGTEAGEGSGAGTGEGSNTGSAGGTTGGGNSGIASLPYREWEKTNDFQGIEKVTEIKRGELVKYNGKFYVSTADFTYKENQWYQDNPENPNNARKLVCVDNSKIVQYYDGELVADWNKFQIYMAYGNIYKTKDGRYYLYQGDPCYQDCPEEGANSDAWVQITGL